MTRGTTPTLIFDFCSCVNLLYAQEIVVTFTQKGEKLFDIKANLLTDIKDNKLYITLTQEQTLSMQANEYLYYQIRILTNDNVLATPIYKTIVFDCLNDTILSVAGNDTDDKDNTDDTKDTSDTDDTQESDEV